MKKNLQRIKQPAPKELTDALLDFLRRKFYTAPGDERAFFQDRGHLLKWVVLWPASWLNNRGSTIHGERYKEIFIKVMLQADAHRSERIKYRPAWLKMVLQSHFKIHGEEYLDQAKSVRAILDQTMLLTGKFQAPAADPVRELALANSLISVKRKKTVPKTSIKEPLNLELKLL